MVTMSSSSLSNQQHQNQQHSFYGVGRAGLLYATQHRRRKRRRHGTLMGVSSMVLFVAAIVFGVLLLLVVMMVVSHGERDEPLNSTSLNVNGDDNESMFQYDSLTSDSVVKQSESKQSSLVVCSQEMNLYCPPEMKCCPKYKKDEGDSHHSAMTVVGYTCLAASNGKYPIGSCCDDTVDSNDGGDLDAVTGSGCSVGYTCASPQAGGASFMASALLRSRGYANSNEKSNDGDGNDGLANVPHCEKEPPSSQPLVDNHGKPISFHYPRMPRYHTCPAMKLEDISNPYGLKIPREKMEYDKQREKGKPNEMDKRDVDFAKEEEIYVGQLAYFTNRGTIDDSGETDYKIKTAVITIHGSSRVSSNYLCFMIRAVKDYVAGKKTIDTAEEMDEFLISPDRRARRQQRVVTATIDNNSGAAQLEDEYLVIAPWFLAPQDGEPETSSSLPFLKWDDDKPISHTFRYGAESTQVGAGGSGSITISSFAAMDALLETLCTKRRFPNLERIVIAGHSAGGQFVHRWGLSSNSWCFNEDDSHPSVRLVAANPRSYSYLDGRRYFPTHDEDVVDRIDDIAHDPMFVIDKDEVSETVLELRPVTSQEHSDCPEFDSYEWGLQDNPNLPAPYVMSNIAPIETRSWFNIFCRYASRDVVYLSGERDVEELENQICNQDGYQGPTRKQRSERFYSSLQVIGKEVDYCQHDELYPQAKLDVMPEASQVHERVVVKNVGHDHALIYVAEEGQRVLFG
ncbi:hypothetical protein HJC23_012530 [Cyclotella cryptica]|uniref:Uncharacterized protein n=1 Tax=Cyclotella cryptica TaxID=29204 RepID=A0ABD3QU01_9STRA|eukprot:CCRYP_003141-RA/>CCRYP_003141-RA protein AED:0.34 eAED:0.34 QI:0/-1/0/1/-1/1/1/0/739